MSAGEICSTSSGSFPSKCCNVALPSCSDAIWMPDLHEESENLSINQKKKKKKFKIDKHHNFIYLLVIIL